MAVIPLLSQELSLFEWMVLCVSTRLQDPLVLVYLDANNLFFEIVVDKRRIQLYDSNAFKVAAHFQIAHQIYSKCAYLKIKFIGVIESTAIVKVNIYSRGTVFCHNSEEET